ncbi:hypothetical protein [Cohnella faecalis]|uniref:Uncharacterized protein n=1 Tax=Cohnella faecalis TaxID=2315694 RepID=A0A398CPH5_9BACL|nr:hypothetical protein [Cohnella faecalis]RIE01817.1 hypothetical protein D3H35_13565 [Cohnella faecalis]
MKTVRWLATILTLFVIISLFALMPPRASATANNDNVIENWHLQWIPAGSSTDNIPLLNGTWLDADVDNPQTTLPDGTIGMWVHFVMPSTDNWQRPGILIERLYLDISVFEGSRLIFESNRDFIYEEISYCCLSTRFLLRRIIMFE